MKKRAWAVLLSVALLGNLYGCAAAGSRDTVPAAEETEISSSNKENVGEATERSEDGAPSETTDYATGHPWINSNIESNVENASDAEIKDNLDLAVNGEWVKNHQIKSVCIRGTTDRIVSLVPRPDLW